MDSLQEPKIPCCITQSSLIVGNNLCNNSSITSFTPSEIFLLFDSIRLYTR